MPVYLKDLPVADPERNIVDRAASLAEYIAMPEVAQLGWPASVVEQWIFDHGGNSSFLADYGAVNLREIRWANEEVPTSDLRDATTGRSDRDYLVTAARLHEHWVKVRGPRVQDAWSELGTWLVPPVLISRVLLGEGAGLQIVEGRTRVGVLQGRLSAGLLVAATHSSWVGRQVA